MEPIRVRIDETKLAKADVYCGQTRAVKPEPGRIDPSTYDENDIRARVANGFGPISTSEWMGKNLVAKTCWLKLALEKFPTIPRTWYINRFGNSRDLITAWTNAGGFVRQPGSRANVPYNDAVAWFKFWGDDIPDPSEYLKRNKRHEEIYVPRATTEAPEFFVNETSAFQNLDQMTQSLTESEKLTEVKVQFQGEFTGKAKDILEALQLLGMENETVTVTCRKETK